MVHVRVLVAVALTNPGCFFPLEIQNHAGSNPMRMGLGPHKSQASWDGIGFSGKKSLDFSCTLRKTNMTSLNITIFF